MNLNITLQIIVSQTLLIPYYAQSSSGNWSPLSTTPKPDRISISNISAMDVFLTCRKKLENHPSTLLSPFKSP